MKQQAEDNLKENLSYKRSLKDFDGKELVAEAALACLNHWTWPRSVSMRG